MESIVTQILNLMTAGLTNIGGAIGEGLTSMVQGIFIETTGSGATATHTLTVFGATICIFAGVSLAFSLVRWVLNFITSLGNRNS